MKGKIVKNLFCTGILAASLCLTPALVYAEVVAQGTTAEETAQSEASASAEEAAPSEETAPAEEAAQESSENTEENEIKDVLFLLDGDDFTITNQTETNYEKTAVVLKQLPGEGNAEEPLDLLLVDEEETEHLFEAVEPKKWKDPVLVEDLGFLYIQYQDDTGVKRETVEKGEEKELEEKAAVHVTDSVNIRSEASVESTAIKGAAQGTAFTAVASAPGWVKVELGGDSYGYISHRFVASDDNTKTPSTVQGTAQSSSSGNQSTGTSAASGNSGRNTAGSSNTSGNTNTGNTGGGNTSTGNTNTGNTSTGNTNTGNTSTGNTGSGSTNTGNTGAGNTNSGNTNSGNTGSGNESSGSSTGENSPADNNSEPSTNANVVTDTVADVDIPDISTGGDDTSGTGSEDTSSGSSTEGGSEAEAEPSADLAE